MAPPITVRKDKLDGALHECLSAMSALNMEPEPLPEPKGTYLSSTDRWAAHALEHLETAFDLLKKEAKLKARAASAIERMLEIKHRIQGCSVENCIPCRENKEVIDALGSVLKEMRA